MSAPPHPGHTSDGYPPSGAYPQQPAGSRGRTATVIAGAAAAVAVLAVVGAVLVVVDVLGDKSEPAPPAAGPSTTSPAAPPSAAPTVDGAPPTDLRLRDDSSTITISWRDPSGGAVPFVVAGGRSGQKLGAMATIDPGQSSYTINGLNPRVDYCFTILAVYSTNTYATSGQVCTNRGTSAAPR
ncbi:fibronectin type III domain-containing protein [Micromonospora echinofusca]|nr:fibronectin type III domain-containing protein [Micromonospora echinofusca]